MDENYELGAFWHTCKVLFMSDLLRSVWSHSVHLQCNLWCWDLISIRLLSFISRFHPRLWDIVNNDVLFLFLAISQDNKTYKWHFENETWEPMENTKSRKCLIIEHNRWKLEYFSLGLKFHEFKQIIKTPGPLVVYVTSWVFNKIILSLHAWNLKNNIYIMFVCGLLVLRTFVETFWINIKNVNISLPRRREAGHCLCASCLHWYLALLWYRIPFISHPKSLECQYICEIKNNFGNRLNTRTGLLNWRCSAKGHSPVKRCC